MLQETEAASAAVATTNSKVVALGRVGKYLFPHQAIRDAVAYCPGLFLLVTIVSATRGHYLTTQVLSFHWRLRV